jgi:nucleotide-binding universal stress UspA family protein
LAIRRILLAVEAASGGPEAVRAAAGLAARLGAQLDVLVIEDVDLLRASALPYVRHVSVPGSDAAFELAALEREMRSFAGAVRRLLEELQAATRLTWSMRVSRGHLVGEITAAAEAADLVVLEAVSRPLVPQLRIASAARAAMARLPRPVFLVPPGTAAAEHVLVLYEDGAQADRALGTAASFARTIGADLMVLAHGATEEERRALEARAGQILAAAGLAAEIRRIARADAARLCALARERPSTLLVLSADDLARRDESERALIDRLDCPLLVVS